MPFDEEEWTGFKEPDNEVAGYLLWLSVFRDAADREPKGYVFDVISDAKECMQYAERRGITTEKAVREIHRITGYLLRTEYGRSDGFKLPRFLEGEELPEGYFDPPDPYREPPKCRYDLRAMTRYAREVGKKVVELTKEEANQFLVNQISDSWSACRRTNWDGTRRSYGTMDSPFDSPDRAYDSVPNVCIMEAGQAARNSHGHRYGSQTLTLTKEQLEALTEGKQLGISIMDGEYALFISGPRKLERDSE